MYMINLNENVIKLITMENEYMLIMLFLYIQDDLIKLITRYF